MIRDIGIDYINVDNPEQVYQLMVSECAHIHWIKKALDKAWLSFKTENWKYDGATFVREHKDEFWEVAAFIHDWLNVTGYVGKEVDLYFIRIMIALNYSENIIFERAKWMQWTWINVLNHKYIKRDFKGDYVPNYLK